MPKKNFESPTYIVIKNSLTSSSAKRLQDPFSHFLSEKAHSSLSHKEISVFYFIQKKEKKNCRKILELWLRQSAIKTRFIKSLIWKKLYKVSTWWIFCFQTVFLVWKSVSCESKIEFHTLVADRNANICYIENICQRQNKIYFDLKALFFSMESVNSLNLYYYFSIIQNIFFCRVSEKKKTAWKIMLKYSIRNYSTESSWFF